MRIFKNEKIKREKIEMASRMRANVNVNERFAAMYGQVLIRSGHQILSTSLAFRALVHNHIYAPTHTHTQQLNTILPHRRSTPQ